MLAIWFARYWPATSWTVLPRTQLIDKGRQLAQHFGFETGDAKVDTEPAFAESLAYYAQMHAADPSALHLSPLSLTMQLPARSGGKKAEVSIDSAGLPVSWKTPGGFRPTQKYSSDDEAANQTFHFFAGDQASQFGPSKRSSGDESNQEVYVWKKRPAPHSELSERIRVITNGIVVESVKRTAPRLSADDDDDDDNGDNKGYWEVLVLIFGFSCTLAVLIALGIYILWLVRRVVSHRFPLRIAAAAFCLILAGSSANGFHPGNIFDALFKTAIILCIVVVGRGISGDARPKWMSLEQLCLLAPLGRSTGESLAAGVLFSPLLAAVPFLIAACRLFPHTGVLTRNPEILYSQSPLLETLGITNPAYLLGLFGFALPALHRLLRGGRLYWSVALLIGVIFFAVQPAVVAGPLFVPLTAGLGTLAIFLFVYHHFDLLAVLTLQFASIFVLSLAMLLVKGGSIWALSLLLCTILTAGWWLASHGQTTTEGDPLATTPAIADFRAEREKLKAEFSVARRAQQDMLPRIPPTIPGYSLAASCTPSLEVGGDLYDFLKLPDGRVGIGVADVSGKGVPAALYMTLTKGLLASVTRNNAQLSSVVGEVNRHLHGVTRKKVFVTMALGFLDAEKRILECVRAGHNPMVWRQASRDETTLVAPGGLGLGITAGRVFGAQLKVTEMPLTDGDAVVFYSDGITEAMNIELEQFGEQRLMDAVANVDHLDAAAARDSILDNVHSFLNGVHPQDDMTLVVLRVGSSPLIPAEQR